MQMQKENGLTNLIYFHTDLMLVLAPDCVWYHPLAPALFLLLALCSVTRAVLTAHTPCWVSGSIPGEKNAGPQKDCSPPWGVQELGSFTVLSIWQEWDEEASWFHGVLEALLRRGKSLCGRAPCILGMLSSMIRKVWPGWWKGFLMQVWLPRQGNDANSVALCSGKQQGCPPWELCAWLSPS